MSYLKPSKRWFSRAVKCPRCGKRLRTPDSWSRDADGNKDEEMFSCHVCGWQIAHNPRTNENKAISPEVLTRLRSWDKEHPLPEDWFESPVGDPDHKLEDGDTEEEEEEEEEDAREKS